MAEKDTEKAKRLKEVYKHVFAHYEIKSQKDFADFLQIQRTGLSAAMNGAKANLTKNLFTKICAAFPGVFNLDYLWTGKGELLTIEERMKFGDVEQKHDEGQIPEYMQRVFDQAASLAQRSEMLEQQLSLALADNRELKNNLKEALVAVDGMKQQIAMVLQIFNPQRTMTQFRENFVNDQLVNAEP